MAVGWRHCPCVYVSRPPVAADRLALTPSGHVRYTLKTPYRDGTTHIVLEPRELMARLAALGPPPHRLRRHERAAARAATASPMGAATR
jgi:hypothetical protein